MVIKFEVLLHYLRNWILFWHDRVRALLSPLIHYDLKTSFVLTYARKMSYQVISICFYAFVALFMVFMVLLLTFGTCRPSCRR